MSDCQRCHVEIKPEEKCVPVYLMRDNGRVNYLVYPGRDTGVAHLECPEALTELPATEPEKKVVLTRHRGLSVLMQNYDLSSPAHLIGSADVDIDSVNDRAYIKITTKTSLFNDFVSMGELLSLSLGAMVRKTKFDNEGSVDVTYKEKDAEEGA